ncbi:lytic polysaccharide monooxygenase [Streptomyces sp. MST-110588]|uniref:lytic polysaccharide monooxygenase auxiliary activity family 9 protein n=1 Tax=Streptomyces sp. MST-110588 TaxID=2833628 RepID=UPI001F5D05C6|nr:lytic polysaccharide monooxygenase [Streptomyces sp. MST-110588]UNO42896.1 lytic polysaccharide monooxygenase [Streptomyces sp. MST-110588]
MTARRTAAGIAIVGIAPLALTALTASPAVAHGSMTDPVSRISACFAEGPEHPRSAACKALVRAGGTQPLYDWNEVNMANAAGRSKQIIPDGKLCSAGKYKYRGLDLPRADWPSTKMRAGAHTFHYKATAPHKGTFELYVTKDGYDPKKPLKWSDLESKPFAKVTNPRLQNGDYVFSGKVPAKSGRHLIYSIWQRSDSPEAFYTCSDVVFGKDNGGAGGKSGGKGGQAAPLAAAPNDAQIAAAADKSTVAHDGHGEIDVHAGNGHGGHDAAAHGAGDRAGNDPKPNGGASKAVDGQHLAKTGGDSSTAPIAIAGASVVALGAAVLFTNARRKAVRHRG